MLILDKLELMQYLLYKELNIKAYRAFGYSIEFYKLAYLKGQEYLKTRKELKSSIPPVQSVETPISKVTSD